MKPQLFSLTIVLFSLFVIGCGSGKPSDLPKLYPCTVKIIDKTGAPVDNASVVATSPDSKWASIGLTDSTGVAVLKTNGIYPGVPLGTFKVIVTKYDVKEVNDEPIETLLFDESFANESTTPLQLKAEAKSNDATFEVF